MPELGFLESYVVPVCLYTSDGKLASIRSTHGTAFFINGDGIYLTAKHVIEEATTLAEERSQNVGLVVKGDSGRSSQSLVAKLEEYNFAPHPFDVAIGGVRYSCSTPLKLVERDINVWQEVATFGYPISAVAGNISDWRINLRAHRGYIQRTTSPEDMTIGGQHPNGFELSFLVGQGMSGSPIFTHETGIENVDGIATSSFRSEVLDYEHLEVHENGAPQYSERKMRIEEFGFAHDIRGLFSWKPALKGCKKTLLEIAAD